MSQGDKNNNNMNQGIPNQDNQMFSQKAMNQRNQMNNTKYEYDESKYSNYYLRKSK